MPDIETPVESFDHAAFVEALCLRIAMTTGKDSALNLVTLLVSGLMTWGPANKAPLGYDQAKDAAAALVLEAVTEVMIAITEMTLTPDVNATSQ